MVESDLGEVGTTIAITNYNILARNKTASPLTLTVAGEKLSQKDENISQLRLGLWIIITC